MAETVPPKLYLLDGTSNIFRAFHAIRGLSSPSGKPTNATFGFTQMLRKLLQEEKPEYLAAAFDRPEPTHRHRAYPEYKATRQVPPEDLVAQIPDIKRVCEVLGVPQVELSGYEADDLIGTLAHQASGDGFQVVIVSSDKDLLQLVDDSIRVLHPVKGELLDREGVRRSFGVLPEQVVEVLALMGDSSDNVPGVPGIGEKGAKDLIGRYGSLEGCLEHVHEIPRKSYRENLVQHQEQARLSRELVRIGFDAPIPWDPAVFRRQEPSREEASRLFGELGFTRLLEEFGPAGAPDPAGAVQQPEGDTTVERIRGAEELQSILRALSRKDPLALVPVFSSPEPMRARLAGIAFSNSPGRSFYAPTARDSALPGAADGLQEAELLDILRPLLEDAGTRKLGGDLKQLKVYLLRHGVSLEGLDLDSTVATYLLDPEHRDYPVTMAEGTPSGGSAAPETARRGIRLRASGDRPAEDLGSWTGGACRTLLGLRGQLLQRLEEAGPVLRLYREVEMPLLSVLAEMEWHGVRVDAGFLGSLAQRWTQDLAEVERRIYGLAGQAFNIQSPRQLRSILFDRLGLTPGRKTVKERSFSTGMDVLEDLAGDHPLPAAILEYRSLAKLLSTYVEALPRLVNPATGRVHTSFNQSAAATGRLSSSNPNLQNIPVRTETGRQIRKAFVAEDGWRILTADYSQIELRVLAHLARDPEMIRAFREGEDIHVRTAAQVFGVAPGLVTSELRRQAKAINFGIVYGMGAFRLGRDLGVSNAAAQRFIDGYFQRFSGVRQYMDEVVETAERHGSIGTLFGRTRPIPEILSRNANVKRQGMRMAINTTVQGTAADLIKMAMVRLSQSLKSAGMRARMLIQVHDELLLEVPQGELEEASQRVREAMESAHPLEVPLVAEVRSGANWLETR